MRGRESVSLSRRWYRCVYGRKDVDISVRVDNRDVGDDIGHTVAMGARVHPHGAPKRTRDSSRPLKATHSAATDLSGGCVERAAASHVQDHRGVVTTRTTEGSRREVILLLGTITLIVSAA